MKTLRYVICDVFAENPLEGNPLTVFTDARGIDGATMHALARETGMSETAFVLSPERGGSARLRIFGPSGELPFAGHPVLGAAFVLAGPLQTDEVRLELPVGIIPVRLTREGARISFGWLEHPQPKPVPLESAGAILEALGSPTPSQPLQAYQSGSVKVCVALSSADAVSSLSPDFSALARATAAGVAVYHCEGQLCTLRYFAPRRGINEDAATGSAVGPLAVELLRRGVLKHEQVLVIEQGRQIGRPSTLYARVTPGDPEPRIEVGGSGRIVARGQFLI
ncbi:MAG: hypothetical protein RL033_3148 [Pseudomonadota bacterium]|jgi:trans-2,3-dihydro-3-hydroxyanthranilate isomerase